jgi:Flp pilus assembly pilin Flp
MNGLKRLTARVSNALKRYEAGQDMAEYVLIMAAIGVAGYTAYVGLEGGIQGLITTVTGILSAA